MAEIYKNSNDPIKTKIFWKGEIVQSGTAVNVVVYDITEDETISPAVSPTQAIIILVAEEDEVNPGTYKVHLPLSLTSRNKKLKLVWQIFVEGNVEFLTTYCDVVTPYVSIAEAIDDLNLGADPSDPVFKNYHDIQMAEKYARKMIENFTGQRFYLYDDEIVVYGTDSDILPLPQKINSIHRLTSNDILLVDNINDINEWGYTPRVTEGGFGIRLDRTDLLDNTVYIANGLVPPTVNDIASGQAFKKNYRYVVKGRFGWESIPDEVEQAAIQIMGHYFSKDKAWADRYIKKVSTFDWDFEYGAEVFSGTGCAYADKLLSDYVVNQMVIV